MVVVPKLAMIVILSGDHAVTIDIALITMAPDRTTIPIVTTMVIEKILYPVDIPVVPTASTAPPAAVPTAPVVPTAAIVPPAVVPIAPVAPIAPTVVDADKTYCFCNDVCNEDDGRAMVECSNETCHYNRWFHFECLYQPDTWEPPI